MGELNYGRVVLPNGDLIGGGYTLDAVIEMAKDMMECEQSLYDFVGDIAIEAKLLLDLTKHIKELEAQIAAKTIEK